MRKLICIGLLAVAGCASNSGVIPAGNGALMISKQQGTGFPGIGSMKADAYREASAYCSAKRQDFEMLNYFETQGPYILGNYPRVDLTFRCMG